MLYLPPFISFPPLKHGYSGVKDDESRKNERSVDVGSRGVESPRLLEAATGADGHGVRRALRDLSAELRLHHRLGTLKSLALKALKDVDGGHGGLTAGAGVLTGDEAAVDDDVRPEVEGFPVLEGGDVSTS